MKLANRDRLAVFGIIGKAIGGWVLIAWTKWRLSGIVHGKGPLIIFEI